MLEPRSHHLWCARVRRRRERPGLPGLALRSVAAVAVLLCATPVTVVAAPPIVTDLHPLACASRDREGWVCPVAVAPDGDIVVATTYTPANGLNPFGVEPVFSDQRTGPGLAIVRFDRSGTLRWWAYLWGREPLLAVDRQGDVYVAAGGWTAPYVSKLSADGRTELYRHQFPACEHPDQLVLRALDVDADGRAHVAGFVTGDQAVDFVGAGRTSPGGTRDAYVGVLSVDGQALEFSSRLGGATSPGGVDVGSVGADEATSIALAPNGDIAIAGTTAANDFPGTAGAPGPGLFVARFRADRTLAFATVIDPAISGYPRSRIHVAADSFTILVLTTSEDGALTLSTLGLDGAVAASRSLGVAGDVAGRAILRATDGSTAILAAGSLGASAVPAGASRMPGQPGDDSSAFHQDAYLLRLATPTAAPVAERLCTRCDVASLAMSRDGRWTVAGQGMVNATWQPGFPTGPEAPGGITFVASEPPITPSPLSVSGSTPGSGPVAGGSLIEVTGSGFDTGTVVTVGGVRAYTEFVSSTLLRAVVPPAAEPKRASVGVVGPDGAWSALDGAFVYAFAHPAPAPTISHVSPPTAVTGSVIDVAGTGFQSRARVTLGGVRAHSRRLSSSRLQVVVPGGVAGTLDMSVENPDGQRFVMANVVSVPADRPIVGALSPHVSATAGGTAVLLEGRNLTTQTRVFFGGTEAIATEVLLRAGPPRLVAVAPPHHAGVVDVVVTNGPGLSVTVPAAFGYVEVLQHHTFVVRVRGNGRGRVTSTPTGLDCSVGQACAVSFPTQPTFHGVADSGMTYALARCSPRGLCDYVFSDGTQPVAQPTVTAIVPATIPSRSDEGNLTFELVGANLDPLSDVLLDGGTYGRYLAAPASSGDRLQVVGTVRSLPSDVSVTVASPLRPMFAVGSRLKFGTGRPPQLVGIEPSVASTVGDTVVSIWATAEDSWRITSVTLDGVPISSGLGCPTGGGRIPFTAGAGLVLASACVRLPAHAAGPADLQISWLDVGDNPLTTTHPGAVTYVAPPSTAGACQGLSVSGTRRVPLMGGRVVLEVEAPPDCTWSVRSVSGASAANLADSARQGSGLVALQVVPADDVDVVPVVLVVGDDRHTVSHVVDVTLMSDSWAGTRPAGFELAPSCRPVVTGTSLPFAPRRVVDGGWLTVPLEGLRARDDVTAAWFVDRGGGRTAASHIERRTGGALVARFDLSSAQEGLAVVELQFADGRTAGAGYLEVVRAGTDAPLTGRVEVLGANGNQVRYRLVVTNPNVADRLFVPFWVYGLPDGVLALENAGDGAGEGDGEARFEEGVWQALAAAVPAGGDLVIDFVVTGGRSSRPPEVVLGPALSTLPPVVAGALEDATRLAGASTTQAATCLYALLDFGIGLGFQAAGVDLQCRDVALRVSLVTAEAIRSLSTQLVADRSFSTVKWETFARDLTEAVLVEIARQEDAASCLGQAVRALTPAGRLAVVIRASRVITRAVRQVFGSKAGKAVLLAKELARLATDCDLVPDFLYAPRVNHCVPRTFEPRTVWMGPDGGAAHVVVTADNRCGTDSRLWSRSPWTRVRFGPSALSDWVFGRGTFSFDVVVDPLPGPTATPRQTCFQGSGYPSSLCVMQMGRGLYPSTVVAKTVTLTLSTTSSVTGLATVGAFGAVSTTSSAGLEPDGRAIATKASLEADGAVVSGLRTVAPGVFQFEVSPLGVGTVGLRLAIPGGVLSTYTLHVVEPPSPGVDADGDGLPDDWELRHGLDPTMAWDAAVDLDGDGVSSYDEFLSGQFPTAAGKRFFAEGAVGPFFATQFAVLNAGPRDALAQFTFTDALGAVTTHLLEMPAMSRRTVDASSALGGKPSEFSTIVESTEPLVVDRTMSWDDRGFGTHAETSVAAPSAIWYLAEGATHSGFELFYLLQNPTAATVDVRVRYLRPSGEPLEKVYRLLPRSRNNIWVNHEQFEGLGRVLSATDVSAVIESIDGTPIIVERAMYLSSGNFLYNAGHESAGVTAPALSWFLAEGATGPYFDLFVLIANPNATPAEVAVNYLLADGRTVPYTTGMTVAPNSRTTIWVDQVKFFGTGISLADAAVSTTVRSVNGVPIIVERAMWWPGGPGSWHEAHNSSGSTTTGTAWALAEGQVGGANGVETYVLIANTSAEAGSATVTLVFEDGGTVQRTYALPARSRVNVAVGPDFGNDVAGRRFGTLVESNGVQIVVERAMYSNAGGVHWAAGTDALATRLR